jgi:hypothetical protein
MSKTLYAENAYVKFEANAVAMPTWGANFGVSLHTQDPGEGAVYTDYAATYTNYAPITVARDAGGLTICDATNPYAANANGGGYKNTAQLTWPESSAGFVGPETLTHAAVYELATGKIVRRGALPTPIVVGPLATPYAPPGTVIFGEA